MFKSLIISILILFNNKFLYASDTILVEEKILQFDKALNRKDKIDVAFTIVKKYIKFDHDDSAKATEQIDS